MLNRERFRQAVKAAGGLRAVMEATETGTIQAVSNWGTRGIPASKCLAFSRATGVPLQELRDDWRLYWPDIEVHDEASV